MVNESLNEILRKLQYTIDDAIRAAAKEQESLSLSGCGKEDFDKGWLPPYVRIIRVLNHGVKETKKMRDHEHDWNGDDYCNICGADERA